MDLTARRNRLAGVGPTLIEEYGSPLYVFYEADLRENYRTMRTALDRHYPDSKIHFAVKACFAPGVLSVLRDEGCGAEAYARCELTATLQAGFDPEEVLLTGMNRRPEDLERALDAGVEWFLVDNATELSKLVDAAEATGQRASVLVRANPGMEVPTHPEVATATHESKFGLDVESGRAMGVAEAAAEAEGVSLAGVQLHIGSQIDGVEPYAVAARELLSFAATIRDELGVEIEVLDLGGGFPVPYEGEVPGTTEIIERTADAIEEAADRHGLQLPTLYLEPGRRLVGNAGTLLASVGVLKETPHAEFAVLDAGTNAVSSYWPYPIYALHGEGDPRDPDSGREYHVAGPLCYTGDVLRENCRLAPLSRGDTIAVDRVGAYSLGSASHTNAEPKPPVVLLRSNGDHELVRERETCADVFGNARMPDDLVR